ncbi:hypothetical protein QMK19_30460 [Streptomyces sp. H10-C2]|uniref:DUF6615 family protein n=1 Tax=unclassified Streptomyces TaxID=2593676 RepID=UPI0024B8AD3E|nr:MULTISPECIES: DUF6615 family protein [unclassified Streptomyces]MDJ0345977.1 hypothetical protein [Streptomyces sp. PH10-H1]MDJ0373856.1 hypothetical protein [Streptomyces sp. H10-C2]
MRDQTLCRTLRDRAEWTFEHLSEIYLNERVPREEVFTSTNLQELARRHGDRVVITEFTQREESRNGADWEWWFYSGKVCFGMRVQAKRAQRAGGGFNLEHRVRGNGRLQSEMLVTDAEATGCLPAYVLYNHRNWVPMSPSHAPVTCRHGKGSQRQLGCTIVSALTVRATLRWPSPSPTFVRNRSVPWHRILCDAGTTQRDALQAAWWEVQNLHRGGYEDLRGTVRAHVSMAMARPRSEADSPGSSWQYPPDDEGPVAWDGAEQGEVDRGEREVLDTPVYRGLNDIAEGPVSPLPRRVRDMIAGRRAEPPDERVAGAGLFNLGEK